MDFLAPGYLLLAAAAAIPLWLHLRRLRAERRVIFPAIRYLRRARQESARRLRLRDWLLLATRLALVLAAALLAAGAVLSGRGDAQHHPPTRVALVVDNSASTGLVQGDRRVLDLLRERALATLTRSNPEDRFWLVPATRAQEAIGPLSASDVAAELRALEPRPAAARLGRAIATAARLVSGDGGPAEIEVFSDLQVNDLGPPLEGVTPPIVVFSPAGNPPANIAITRVQPARTPVSEADEPLLIIRIDEFGPAVAQEPGAEVTVRAVLGGRVLSLGSGTPGSEVTLALRPRPAPWLDGYLEIDPSGLRADDRRFFTLPVRPPTRVAVLGAPGPFVEAALSALESGSRVQRALRASSADVVWAAQGEGLMEALRDGRRAVVAPGDDPLGIPVLNARLERAGVPWRYRYEEQSGFTAVGPGAEAIPGVRGQRVRYAYRLEPVGTSDARTWVRLETGGPWLVSAQPPGLGTAMLLAGPLTERATDLVTAAAMIPFLDALVNGWPGEAEAALADEVAGGAVLPGRATSVEFPSGIRRRVEGGAVLRDLEEAGVYRVYAGDSLLHEFAVNPPASESDLARATGEHARQHWRAADVVVGGSESAWLAAIYRARRGRDVTAPLLAAFAALILLESLAAAPGAVALRRRRPEALASPTGGSNGARAG